MTSRRKKRGAPVRHWLHCVKVEFSVRSRTGCGLKVKFPRMVTLVPARVTCVACRSTKAFDDYLAHRMEKALS